MKDEISGGGYTVLPKGCFVIMHIGLGPSQSQDAESHDLIVQHRERFYLREDIWIERLDELTATNIQHACEPAHYKITRDIQDRHLYAFVMDVPAKQKTRYEGLSILQSAVALSRLANPTSTGDRYCAQVIHFGLPDSAVHAIEHRGSSVDVALGHNSRDWLTKEDGEVIKKLMAWTSANKAMLPRVHRAYWNHEYAMRCFHIDIRWMFVVEGLDALINTGSNNEHYFVTRIKKIADNVGIAVTQAQLRSAYRIRSKLVHTEKFLHGLNEVLPQIEHDSLYEKLEQILRATVRTALLDERFAQSFASADAVAESWIA